PAHTAPPGGAPGPEAHAAAPPGVRLRRVGLAGWLVEVPADASPAALHSFLVARRAAGELPGVVDLVPGARTVLVDARPPGPARSALAALLARWDPARGADGPPPRSVTVPVRYDGADLADVARLTGLTEREVVALHSGADATVAFCGFAPGFAYLAGLPAALRVPRLATPRAAVPAGAVAVAEEYTGIYPRPSPGGWRILGRTAVRLWDPRRAEPALLTPGTRVRFVPEPW
ncbi:MAG TPA: allophanate hydrolase subunit 1, partial [Pilimelia sp.]|nr:allophanate hydrolase subunit 1 [Pilimelia sp.]